MKFFSCESGFQLRPEANVAAERRSHGSYLRAKKPFLTLPIKVPAQGELNTVVASGGAAVYSRPVRYRSLTVQVFQAHIKGGPGAPDQVQGGIMGSLIGARSGGRGKEIEITIQIHQPISGR